MYRISRRTILVAAIAPAAWLALIGPAGAAECNGKTVTIPGTSGNDRIFGTTGNDVIATFAGSDIVEPSAGNDTICGGADNDQLRGGDGADWIDGGDGDDVLKGNDGADDLRGGEGYDGINGGPHNDVVYGGQGDDFIVGHDGDDTISGNLGKDAIYGGNGNDTLYGHSSGGTDTTEPDYIAGGPGVDSPVPGPPPDAHYEDRADSLAPVLCPPDDFRAVGAYNPSRLAPRTTGCTTIIGKPVFLGTGMHNDGDYTFNIGLYHVEFMPRDKFKLPLLSPNVDVMIRGLGANDTNHNDKLEIHPVFEVTVGGTIVGNEMVGGTKYYSGPQFGGSPEQIRPTRDSTRAGSDRYCWNELGVSCQAWDTTTGPFD